MAGGGAAGKDCAPPARHASLGLRPLNNSSHLHSEQFGARIIQDMSR